MMLALRAFFKALKNKNEAKAFVDGKEEKQDPSHLKLLYLLQKQGRLIDFLKEDIASFSDAQIGAAVRNIHQDCAQSLEEWVSIRPVLKEGEGQEVLIPEGYDHSAIKVVGKVKGNAPYKGVLRHKGWQAQKQDLPKQIRESDQTILCPAEVEV